MDHFRHDLRLAWRALRQRPGFSLVVILTLAVAIGANTAIFSVVNGVMLRPLPYDDPDRLVVVWQRHEAAGYPEIPISIPDFLDHREQAQSFSFLVQCGFGSRTLTGVGEPENIQATQVSPALFTMLGTRPQLGRLFDQAEEEPGAERVVLLDHAYWRDRFASDPQVVGREISLDGVTFTVVGVLPRGFSFPPPITFLGQMLPVEPRLYEPLILDPERMNRGNHQHMTFGRLADGVTFDQARDEIAAITARLGEEYPESAGLSGWIAPLHAQSHQLIRGSLLALLGAVGFVLLIACANVANLMLVRAGARRREIAIRMAVGADRRRLVSQLMTESLLLSLLGGLAGLLLSLGLTSLLVRLNPIQLPGLFDASLDGRVLGFTLGAVVITALLFGLVPAFSATRERLREALGTGGRSSEGPRQNRLKRGFVVAQTTLALMLLTGTGLMLKSLLELQKVDLGFEAERLIAVPLGLPDARYDTPESWQAFFDEAVERLAALPGVTEVAYTTAIPFNFDVDGGGYEVEGKPPSTDGNWKIAFRRRVSPGYLAAMGTRLVDGRFFDETDTDASQPVAVVNQAYVRREWPGESALGRRITFDDLDDEEDPPTWLTIVGVVEDVRHMSVQTPEEPAVLFPFPQDRQSYGSLLVRTSGRPDRYVETVRAAIWEIDPDLPVSDTQFMSDARTGAVAEPRFLTLLSGIFGGIALLLAALGLYGLIAFVVTRQSRDFGVRVAFGATPGDLRRLVLGWGLGLAAIGIGLGLVGSLLVGRLIQNLLYGVSPLDPAALTLSALLLAGVALVAAWLPARRATRTSPMVVLRSE